MRMPAPTVADVRADRRRWLVPYYIFKVNPGLQRIILSNSRLEKDILIKASKDALKNLKEKLETEEALTLEKEGGNS